jgi:hypothetical protein
MAIFCSSILFWISTCSKLSCHRPQEVSATKHARQYERAIPVSRPSLLSRLERTVWVEQRPLSFVFISPRLLEPFKTQTEVPFLWRTPFPHLIPHASSSLNIPKPSKYKLFFSSQRIAKWSSLGRFGRCCDGGYQRERVPSRQDGGGEWGPCWGLQR